MAVEWTSSVLKCAPAGVEGASVTPNAGSGTNSAWFEVQASTPAAWLLAGIDVRGFVGGGIFYEAPYEIDVGVGAAGSEVVKATFPGHNDGSGCSHAEAVLPILIDAIPASSRVAVRLRRWVETDVTPWNISLWYYDKPIVGLVTTTTQALKVLGSSTPWSNALSAAWAQGSWTQVIAATSTAIVIPGLWIEGASNAVHWEMDIGVGAAGLEVVRATVRGVQGVDGGTPRWIPLYQWLDGIASGSRVAVRGRGSHATSSGTCTGILAYMEEPL